MSVGWCSPGGGGGQHVWSGSTLGQTFAQLTHALPATSRVTSHISLKYTLVSKIDTFFGSSSQASQNYQPAIMWKPEFCLSAVAVVSLVSLVQVVVFLKGVMSHNERSRM